MMTYEITHNKKTVGTAQVEREGLYYRLSCRCQLPDRDIYVLWLQASNNKEKLGICVPKGDVFCLDTKVAVKHIGDGPFRIVAEKRMKDGFYTVEPDKPFPKMDRIGDARFQVIEGRAGLVIPD